MWLGGRVPHCVFEDKTLTHHTSGNEIGDLPDMTEKLMILNLNHKAIIDNQTFLVVNNDW